MSLDSLLKHAASTGAEDVSTHHPRVLDVSVSAEREELEQLLREGRVTSLHDTFDEQLRDLLSAREPARKLGREELSARVQTWLAGRTLAEAGRWVYYPWARRLVHLLAEADFRELRTDRNRLKITRPEQEHLRRCRIAIAGLSVGLSSALTLAQEGVGGAFNLADFDTLGVSNLNRLRAGVGDLGLRKTVLAARQLFEMDPYLEVSLFPEGVTEQNLDTFLGVAAGAPRVDLLVEECDELRMKLRLRERAREARLPVIMETSDQGMLDVERFDLEPERPLLHGLVGQLSADALGAISGRERLAVVLRILDERRLSARMAASMMEVGESVSTWPQLASAVALGGAVATDTARRLLLGKLTCSGRYYVDLEQLIRPGAEVALEPLPEPGPAPEALAPRQLPPRPAAHGGPVSAEEARYLVGCGVLAPSPGNSQPWRFRFEGGVLRCAVDAARARALPDFEACVALGAAVENITLAARALGLSGRVEPSPGPAGRLEWTVALAREGAAEAPALLAHLPVRVTNRKPGVKRPLAPGDAEALRSAPGTPAARLLLVEEHERLGRLGALLGGAERLRLLSEATHREAMAELRWSLEEARRGRDGVDVATLELDAADATLLRLQSRWPVMAALAEIGTGGALERSARLDVAHAAAVGLLVMEGAGPEAAFAGGRALERVWLTAAARGLAVLPYRLPALFARLGRGEGLGPAGRARLEELGARYRELLAEAGGGEGLVVLRFAYAHPPRAHSLRRPVDEVLQSG